MSGNIFDRKARHRVADFSVSPTLQKHAQIHKYVRIHALFSVNTFSECFLWGESLLACLVASLVGWWVGEWLAGCIKPPCRAYEMAYNCNNGYITNGYITNIFLGQ